MSRELKFRAWDGEKMRVDFTIDAEDGMIGRGVQVIRDWHIMQFTGLKDKHGVEIYEGDICRFDVRASFEEDSKPVSNAIGQVNIGSRETSFGCWDAAYVHNITVIGNIYQNKNLLEQ